MGHVTMTTALLGRYGICRIGLATINLFTNFKSPPFMKISKMT